MPPRVYTALPWLTVDMGQPCRVAGWPVVGASLGMARTVTWLQVCDADLPCSVDPGAFFLMLARRDGVPAEIGLLTAADIGRHAVVRHQGSTAVVTAGLGNGESVLPGPPVPLYRVGTINMLAVAPVPLSERGLLEALSIITQARTTAILELGLRLPDGRPLTGTGTDCIVVAAPLAGDDGGQDHCGLHTEAGRALAAAAFAATGQACARWLEAMG